MFDCIMCLCCRSEHLEPSSTGGSTECLTVLCVYVLDLSTLDPALQEVLQNISADGYTLFKQKCALCGKMIGNMRRHMLVRTLR